ncbi:MAG: ABC transporter ATP-binding protein [Pseudomonadota bacterium]
MRDAFVTLTGATIAPGGRIVAQGLSIDLRAGQLLAILGPNGRGKTTLIRALVGALPLKTGARHVRGALGYVPQGAALGFDYKVREVVVMGRARHLGLFQSPRPEDYAVAEAALDRVGMAHLQDQTVTTLSGGERQLVMVARALAGDCDLLILDEPASALDLKNQHKLFQILSSLAHDDGLGIAFSTHVPGHAFEAADDVLLLYSEDSRVIGAAADVLTETALSALYGTPVRVLEETGPNGTLRAAVASVGPP